MSEKAVFLDRDGTVIPDRGYLDTVEGVELPEANGRALRRLMDAGFLLVVISNQSGIGRGYFPAGTVEAQHARLASLASRYGVQFAGFAYCPHAPTDGCSCRKPSPEMILAESRRLNIDIAASYMVGDKVTDTHAGQAAGCHTILLGTGNHPDVDCVVPDLPAAVSAILTQDRRRGPDGEED